MASFQILQDPRLKPSPTIIIHLDQTHKMLRFLENTVISFKRLGSQQETPSMQANSSGNSIRIYQEDGLWLARVNDEFSPLYDPMSVPKLFRPRLLVGKINVSTPLETSYAGKPSSIDMQGGLGPFLFKLPGEIRNMIYPDLLSSGHPQFLRTSKALYIEGSGLIQEKGIYRMNFGFPNSINRSLPSQRVVDTIRHLDIRANVSDTIQDFPDIWLLQAFGGPRIGRDICNVSFESYPSINRICLTRVCRSLRLLSGFERVVVRVKFDSQNPVHWSDYKLQSAYGLIRAELEQVLGKPYFGQDEDGLYMGFHPRKALEGLADSPEIEM